MYWSDYKYDFGWHFNTTLIGRNELLPDRFFPTYIWVIHAHILLFSVFFRNKGKMFFLQTYK